MHRPSSKRVQLIKRTAVYTTMCVAIVALVAVLVFVTLGYQFNGKSGKIVQGGLVQFNSEPSGAKITIDGVDLGANTAAKTNLVPGSHFISMTLQGYRTWEKSVTITPGQVLWLTYPRLIPNTIKTADVLDYDTVTSTSASPDKKWMAIKDDATTPTIQLVNISQSKIATSTLTLPDSSYTQPPVGGTQTFTITAWDPSSRYIMLEHTYTGATSPEWLDVDTQNVANTQNITTLLGINASKVIFSNNDSNTLYVQTGQDVREVNVSAGTLSRPLISNVNEFALYGNSMITYTTLPDATTKERTAGYYQQGAEAPQVIHTYAANDTAPIHIAINQYFGTTYIALADGNTVTVQTGNLPKSAAGVAALKPVTTFHTPDAVTYLSIITSGRFIVAQSSSAYTVYDLELQKLTTTPIDGTAPITAQLGWIDGYMPWSDRDGELRFYEFDGANQNDIMPVAPGFSVTLSQDNTYVYGIGYVYGVNKTDTHYALERAQLIL